MKFKNIRRSIAGAVVTVVLCSCNLFQAFGAVEDIKVSTSENGNESFLLTDMPEITAQGAIVVDLETGFTIYEKNIYERLYPASTTKIMTATLAIENLNPDDMVTYSHNAVYSIEPGSSSAYMREGEQITVEQSLYGLMMISGNDLANGLGETVAGGSIAQFATMMNAKAKELGCVQTNFVNPHGLHDDDHYTCPYDLALIAKYAFQEHDYFRKLISETRYTVAPTEYCKETRYWHNGNKLIMEGELYYDEDCLGGKTGYTSNARASLVSFHEINGRTILIVGMKMTTSFDDTRIICEYLNENVDEMYWKNLDAEYQKLVKQEEETTGEDKLVKPVAGEPSVKEPEEDNSTPFFLKVILVIVIVFLLYYLYLNIQRRKRRLLKGKRKKHKTNNVKGNGR